MVIVKVETRKLFQAQVSWNLDRLRLSLCEIEILLGISREWKNVCVCVGGWDGLQVISLLKCFPSTVPSLHYRYIITHIHIDIFTNRTSSTGRPPSVSLRTVNLQRCNVRSHVKSHKSAYVSDVIYKAGYVGEPGWAYEQSRLMDGLSGELVCM